MKDLEQALGVHIGGALDYYRAYTFEGTVNSQNTKTKHSADVIQASSDDKALGCAMESSEAKREVTSD